jgi:hypothetical protein
MARRNFDSTDMLQFFNRNWPTCGQQSFTGSTKAIALTTIEATDLVVASVLATTTASYVTTLAITAGTGFIVTMSAATDCTVSYLVFKNNS